MGGDAGNRAEESAEGRSEDAILLAQLDTSDRSAEAWRRLLALADEFAAIPHLDEDTRVVAPSEGADGTWTAGYVAYGPRIREAVEVLAGVRAVTWAFDWMRHPTLQITDYGPQISPADAVRLSTWLVRGDRFVEGRLGDAAERGTLQAVLASLADWHRAAGEAA